MHPAFYLGRVHNDIEDIYVSKFQQQKYYNAIAVRVTLYNPLISFPSHGTVDNDYALKGATPTASSVCNIS